MDFDLRETLKEHSGNCEIAMLQPGEEHLDHTYSKGVSTATISNMFDTNEKEQQSIQSQLKTISKQIPNFGSNKMKTELWQVKSENQEWRTPIFCLLWKPNLFLPNSLYYSGAPPRI